MPLPGIRCLGRGWLEWNRRCAVRLVWTILVLLVLPLAARAELVGDASFEGVVTSLAGVPAVQRGSIVSPLAPGAVILPGDSVRLAEGDEIRILLRTGRLLESRGPARLRLADEFGKEEWYSPIIRDVLGERFGLYDTEMGRGPNIATNAFRQISPYNASVLFGKTECQWAAPAGYERFQVVIRGRSRQYHVKAGGCAGSGARAKFGAGQRESSLKVGCPIPGGFGVGMGRAGKRQTRCFQAP